MPLGMRNLNQAVATSSQLHTEGRRLRGAGVEERGRAGGNIFVAEVRAAVAVKFGALLRARARVTRKSSSGGSLQRQVTLRRSSSIWSMMASP